MIKTSNGERIEIDRVDRQGLVTPGPWNSARMGEPTSVAHAFDNYVKAAPDTLFRHQGLAEKYKNDLPNYPQNIYGYYALDRFVTVGFVTADSWMWNAALSEVNADMGQARQANIIVVVVDNKPDEWYYALEEKWIGGKKNDIILVVSVDGDMKPQWANVMCWTTNELFKVKLRDDVMNDPILTRESVVADLRTNVDKYFVRKPMADFKYLTSSITPSTTEWIITLVLSLLVAGCLAYFFEVNDVFGEKCSKFRSL